MAVRINLMPNPSFEVDASGWTTASRGNSNPALAVAGGWYVTLPSGETIGPKVPATAGLDYTGSAYLSAGSTIRTSGVTVRFFDDAGTELSAPTPVLTAYAAASTPERRSSTRTAPAGTKQVALALHTSSSSHTADAVMLEQSSVLGDYFDGSTTKAGYTYAWSGTAHASPSTETPPASEAKTIASALSGAGTLTSSLAFRRTNYCTNPSFETNLTGWTAEGAISWSRYATAAAGTVSAGPTADGVSTLVSAVAVPATAGEVWTVSASAKTPSNINVIVGLRFVDSGGATLTQVLDDRSMVNGAFYLRGVTAAVAPAATAGVKVVLGANASATFFDAVQLEKSSTRGTYFDGSTVKAGYTYAWSAAPQASTSTETPVIAGAPKTASSALSGSGTLTSATTQPTKRINSALSGSGSLTSALAYTKRINSALSGTGTLSAKLRRNIASTLSGSGTLTSVLSGRLIKSNLSGSGTLTSALRRTIQSALSGSGSLTSSLAYAKRMESAFSGSGTLSSVIDAVPTKQISSALGGEGVLFSELGYVVKPDELGTGPLGKLSSFTVSTSAVQLNPSEGSGSTPSINATYTNGVDPEYALGETNVLKNGAIGTYEGEVVKVGTSQSSGRASISMNTALTPLNVELHLFPFIDGVPGLGTAARAIDYWTQQCGLFYEKVPGQCVAYVSGFGHVDAFGAGTTARFYERLTGGTTTTRVVNGRSVRTLGAAVTGTTKFHEAKDETVQVTLPKNRKLVFSAGLGLSGSGRMGTVEWSFLDPKDVRRTVTLTGTSDGGVSASIDGATALAASVPAGGSYRLAFSLERVSTTALVGKLTIHTDDLAGSGDLVYASSATVIDMELSSILRLTSITHSSAGGAGTEMTRWGTYLTVADLHPMEVPAIQKVLGQSKKPFEFVSGFTGNVWNLLNEFCSIARLEVRFIDGALHVEPRSNAIVTPGTSWALFDVDRQRREKYKQVAVVNKQSKAVTTDDAVLWRADSVYQVAAREVFETTVQTGHSILNVVNPVAVSGITPFPYKKGAGQYVVTGADGYIIAPAWWNDNGGKVEVSLTGVEGEIAIKITAPALETVRAPYRISEGEADRPALYVSGSGILNDPTEVHVSTGAKNAREGFDNVFESPFIAGVRETYDTAAAMAHQYSASVAEVQYELPNSFETPTGLGQFPAGVLVTDNLRNYRIQDASQTHSKVSGNAVAYTTIGAYVASYPAGATLRDEKARHAGRTIRKFNIKPLKGDA